jgi:hypothetical protein
VDEAARVLFECVLLTAARSQKENAAMTIIDAMADMYAGSLRSELQTLADAIAYYLRGADWSLLSHSSAKREGYDPYNYKGTRT